VTAAWRGPDRAAHRADLRLLGAALLWQVLTFLLPMGMVLGRWSGVGLAAVLWAGLGWYLWRAPESPPAAA